ncbi:hypothetical protein [Absidia glauca]|uniref:Uncharacterized protein n=1 Tax=Absidia glauca TaxID=4829 RepID=A0A163J6J0_ABSGL|nr:hypothetical protein [Absidia glauca]
MSKQSIMHTIRLRLARDRALYFECLNEVMEEVMEKAGFTIIGSFDERGQLNLQFGHETVRMESVVRKEDVDVIMGSTAQENPAGEKGDVAIQSVGEEEVTEEAPNSEETGKKKRRKAKSAFSQVVLAQDPGMAGVFAAIETRNLKRTLDSNDSVFDRIQTIKAARTGNRRTVATAREQTGDPQTSAVVATATTGEVGAAFLMKKTNELTVQMTDLRKKSTAYFLQTYLFHQYFHEQCEKEGWTISELFNQMRKEEAAKEIQQHLRIGSRVDEVVFAAGGLWILGATELLNFTFYETATNYQLTNWHQRVRNLEEVKGSVRQTHPHLLIEE